MSQAIRFERLPNAVKGGAPEFERGLVEHMPRLRAFARSLSSDPARADDLVQETMLKALDKRSSYAMGTNQRAWLFTILKNTFYSEIRRRRREVDIEDAPEPRVGGSTAAQEAAVALNELGDAVDGLPEEQRRAVLLVGAAGMSYEEAAERCGCAVGTIKSRVSRARNQLALH